ncbi:FAD dependent oxidoreductase [Mycena sp. CBHHK59/15]|nr:FAD dependent oxidoreductase [Mycena sp. CBHHK59/15]
MGSILSRARLIYQTLKSISDSYLTLSNRISLDPGLPVPDPSVSYWCIPPSPLAGIGSSKDIVLPLYADIVIIGSGISGTAIARTLLDCHSKSANKDTPLRVFMLEARDVCSGATGRLVCLCRNGGHISPNLYQDYPQLEATYGASAAQQIIKFRLAHLPAFLAVAEEENLLRDSQARKIQQLDVFLNDQLYQRAKKDLATYLSALPEQKESYKIYENRTAIQNLQLSSYVAGCLSTSGGAIHPYRLVTAILARLLDTYPSFQLFTHTPCTDITSPGKGENYVVSTPKGTVSTPHVIHATNAWSSHLLPGMRRKIVPMRVHMTVQRPGRNLGAAPAGGAPWTGTRSFVFYPGTSPFAFDYLTQMPPPPAESPAAHSPYPPPAGEMMFGGGAMLGGRAESALMDNIGIVDDTQCDFEVGAYLGGVLERYFAGWGAESGGDDVADSVWGTGRMKAFWSGIMGLSADGQPWVGRLPRGISRRVEPQAKSHTIASPGEWISAGFTGEGMTHAWLSGVALARMVLNLDGAPESSDLRLPSQFNITEKRWKEADIEAFFEGVV